MRNAAALVHIFHLHIKGKFHTIMYGYILSDRRILWFKMLGNQEVTYPQLQMSVDRSGCKG